MRNHLLVGLCLSFVLILGAPAHSEEIESLPDDDTFEGFEPVPLEALLQGYRLELLQFTEPKWTETQKKEVLARYSYLDPKKEVPASLMAEAVLYWAWNYEALKNKSFLTVIDFKRFSGMKRFFVVNMSTGKVWSTRVAHGTGSDQNNDGYAERFLNVVNSLSSSLGPYLTAETYNSQKFGLALRLDGLASTNNKARERAVVFHGSNYVKDKYVKQGRSWGCPAIPMDQRTQVVNWIKGGSLMYAGLSK